MDLVREKNKNAAFGEHCSLGEALSLLLREFAPGVLGSVRLPPSEALGRVLAEDIVSRRNVPHYTASAVDGYTLAALSTAGATPATPVLLERGEFEWVNTGMPTAQGDAVVMVEDTSAGEDGRLKVFRSLTQGENVRAVGEDVMAGQILAVAGDTVTPALVSLLLCAGIPDAAVRARPRTLFIPTGDEIVGAESWLARDDAPAGVVVDSNSAFARASFAQWGFELDVHPILPDDPALIRGAIEDAVKRYDLVLVSAGSAKGRRDHTADIFQDIGRMLFRAVRMKPGRPVMAASVAGRPVVCTPGFPMSCAVVLWSIVYPLLRSLSGESLDDALRKSMGSSETIAAKFMSQHSSPAGVAEWLRLKVARVKGEPLAWPLSAGASVLWALAEADGIALLGEEALECEKGSAVQIHLMKKLDLERRLLFQGSDDPAIQLLVSLMRQRGMDLAIRAVGSMGGLAALSRGEAHFAAAHLLDPADGSYNTSYIEKFSAGRRWRRQLVFFRQQGIIVAKGNPRNITKFGDLTGTGVVFENRQPGAGTRVLLDYMLKSEGMTARDIPGYERQSITHLEAANKVASGVADATLGIKAAADALGLGFIPIAREPYELVFDEDFGEHAAADALLDAIASDVWRAKAERMGGYEWAS